MRLVVSLLIAELYDLFDALLRHLRIQEAQDVYLPGPFPLPDLCLCRQLQRFFNGETGRWSTPAIALDAIQSDGPSLTEFTP